MDKVNFISAAIVTYNDGKRTEKICVQLLKYTVKYPLKLYVIDNASSDDTVERISKLSGVKLIKNNTNKGFGAAHNQVLNYEIGRYHFVINPDIEINGDILSEMADFMDRNTDIVMSMPKIINQDGTEQKLPKEKPTFTRLFLGRFSKLGGVFKKTRIGYTWADRDIADTTDIGFCSGCFFCIKGNVFSDLRGFDERYFMYLEDADLTLRALRHGRVVMASQFSVTHLWERESAKSLKYFLIHADSSFKFLYKWRKTGK